MAWLAEHSAVASVIVNLLLMMVWVIYLNLFFFNMVRTRRPVILVSRGVGTGTSARLFVSNMGAEPIYVSALIADVETPDGSATAYITTNRNILSDDASGLQATNEGPLGSGAFFDAGGFSDILARAADAADTPVDPDRVERIMLTVVASTGHSALISAGRKTYDVLRDGDDVLFHPTALSTEQLRSRRSRQRIRKRLERQLERELDDRRDAESRRGEDATA